MLYVTFGGDSHGGTITRFGLSFHNSFHDFERNCSTLLFHLEPRYRIEP